jgi:hypothetical protein
MLKNTLAALALVSCTLAHAGTPAPAVPPTVEPDNISYSNASVSWLRQWANVDGFSELDVDSNGIAAALEYSPVNHLYLALGGSWSDAELSGPGGSVNADYWTLNGGVGGYIPLAHNVHFVTEVGASYADLDLGGFGNQDDWGVYVTPHIRAKFGAFEVHGGVSYNSNDVTPTEWSAFARALYEVCPNVDLFVTGTFGLGSNDLLEDVFGLNLGVRFKF